MTEQEKHAKATPHPATADDLKKLAELTQDIRIVMLTTAEPDGTLRSRPMAQQQADTFDGTIYFFTQRSSAKLDEIAQDRHVNLSYADPSDDTYVSISGTARELRDEAKMKELWSPALKAWFPDGLEDPELTLLKVTATQAEFWDTNDSTVVKAIGFVKAVVTGTEYEPGENVKVSL